MKKQKSITQFTVAADNPVALHNSNSNNRPIAAASSSVNSSNNVFEKPYQTDQTYRFPKRLFGKRQRKRPFQSAGLRYTAGFTTSQRVILLFVIFAPNTIEMRTWIQLQTKIPLLYLPVFVTGRGL